MSAHCLTPLPGVSRQLLPLLTLLSHFCSGLSPQRRLRLAVLDMELQDILLLPLLLRPHHQKACLRDPKAFFSIAPHWSSCLINWMLL